MSRLYPLAVIILSLHCLVVMFVQSSCDVCSCCVVHIRRKPMLKGCHCGHLAWAYRQEIPFLSVEWNELDRKLAPAGCKLQDDW